MKISYSAGSYTGSNSYEILKNIRRAEKINEWLWSIGYANICPHTNTRFLDGMCDNQVWLTGYLNILQMCEIMFLIPGWENSSGTKDEIKLARQINIPIYECHFTSMGEIWMEEYKG